MSPALRVLLVEDNPGDVELVRAHLEDAGREWILDVAMGLEKARRSLESADYDLVLTDLGLPETQGLETFLAVQEASGPETPVVVLTGLIDSELGRRAVSAGAQDYLVKDDLSAPLLSRAMEYAVERHQLALEAERRERMARETDRLAVIGRVVGGVAHEFNNLLTAMQGYAQLLEADPSLSEEQRESVEEILEAAGRAGEITRELLAYSRRQVLSPADFDLGVTVDEMRALIESALGRRYDLRFELPSGPARVHADRGQVEHAVMHLVSNAKEAMEDGGTVQIAVRRESVSDDDGPTGLEGGDYLVLEVADDGPGMPADVLDQAREPFYTTRRFGEAMGLGLSTVEGIADQSGGALQIETEPGEGTTARVFLPRAEASSVPAEEDPPLSGAEGDGRADTVRETSAER